jgi:hydrogenase-1 operon protein HyaF
MTDYPLVWRPKVPAPTKAGEDPSLRLLDMPVGATRPRRDARRVDSMSPAARAVLEETAAALREHADGDRAPSLVSLRSLGSSDRDTILDVLGEGDVWGSVGGNVGYTFAESVLTGLWHVEATSQDGAKTEWLEVGAIPQAVLHAAEHMPRESIRIPDRMPQGAMNSLALLTELQQRSAAYQPGEENHIINFTLLPITEADAEVLTTVLGQIPLVIRGGGYGSCRIFAAGLRHVWAVQYLNSMDKVILDTLEIGGVPVAALATREDLADSAGRLPEMMQAYAS